MNRKDRRIVPANLREDFETYLYDGHTALAAITSMRRSELQEVALILLSDAPNSLSRALAIFAPLDAERQDTLERFVQAELPLARA